MRNTLQRPPDGGHRKVREMYRERDRGAPAVQARCAIENAVVRICEAEGWLEDAAKLSPAVGEELLRLQQVLHETGIAALEARRLLEREDGE